MVPSSTIQVRVKGFGSRPSSKSYHADATIPCTVASLCCEGSVGPPNFRFRVRAQCNDLKSWIYRGSSGRRIAYLGGAWFASDALGFDGNLNWI